MSHVSATISKYLSVIRSYCVSQFITTQMDLPFDNLCITPTDPEHVILLISLNGLDLSPNVLGALFLLLLPSRQKRQIISMIFTAHVINSNHLSNYILKKTTLLLQPTASLENMSSMRIDIYVNFDMATNYRSIISQRRGC